jgi:CRAL/TRIO domain
MLGDPGRAKFNQFDRTITKSLLSSIRGSLPVRVSVFLIVHPPAFASLVLPIMKLFMNERMRKRINFFTGSDEKVLAELQNRFGLTKDMLPTTIGGNVKIQHREWIKRRSDSGL